jgi:hypothetical protein
MVERICSCNKVTCLDQRSSAVGVRWLLLVLAFAVHGSWADTLVGKVVAIADGDTLTVFTGKFQDSIGWN